MSTYTAEAHADWHAAHGPNKVCPLDCYTPAEAKADAEWAAERQAADDAARDADEKVLGIHGAMTFARAVGSHALRAHVTGSLPVSLHPWTGQVVTAPDPADYPF